MSAADRSCQLGLFAKHWTPGQVKTRLARAIGADSAAKLHFTFLKTLLKRFESFPVGRCLVFTPREREQDFREIAGDKWALEVQKPGDLGERMSGFFRSALDQGAERIVIIGSDSPTVPVEFVSQSFDLLARHPAVIGPSCDGGYYLIGISTHVPPIFEGIEWSTPNVLAQTLAKAAEWEIPIAQLPPWYDVDEWTDLERLALELQTDKANELGQFTELIMDLLKKGRGWKIA